jgi:PAS domain S-box-containing protein
VTRSTSAGRPPRLVLRFALYSALALVLAGTGILFVVRHEAQVRADRELTSDATRAAATLSTQLRKADLTEPVTSTERLAALDALVAPELMNGVVRVKLWRRDGTVTYSNDHSLIGTRVDAEELDEVLAGRTVRETGRLNDEGGQGKNIKVTSAYVPLRLADEQRPRGVLEFYNDYGPIEAQVVATVKPIALALGLALLLLFGSLFPILRQVTKALQHRSDRLAHQAEELERTLNERRQAVAGLREAESRYRALVEQLPLVTYVSAIDKPGFSAYVSPQIDGLLGYSPDEWLATPNLFWRVVHPDDLERVRTEHRTGYATGRPFSTQYRLVARDGRVVWVEDQVIVIADATGAPVQAQGFLLDITHRKAAEVALSESEYRFRTLVANVPGVIFRCSIDNDWTMEFLSDEIDELTGYPASDFIANRVRTFASVIHPEDAPRLTQEIEAAVAEERPYTIEYRTLHRDGSIRHVVERGQAILGRDGERRLDGAIFDLSERRATQQALEESEERTRLIVDTALDAVVTIDAAGLITGWNAQAEAIFGWSAEEAVGRLLAETIIPAQHREAHTRGLERFLATGEGPVLGKRIEISGLRRDGEEFPVELAISPVKAGGSFSFSAFLRDISERRTAEDERERLLEDLAAQNERLLELDRLKDEFVALVSHELRTPLTSIRGYLELVLEEEAGALTDEQRQFLGVVERNAHRLLALVGDLLFLAQVEAGKLSLELGAVDLSAIAAESVETARPLAEERDITLTLATGPLALIAGDHARLAQLLDNLISNGVKFTPPGGRVDVRVKGQRGKAVIEVRDTGMGIPSEEQHHLFERFFRTAKATEQAIPGTGLGLAISKAIVDAHRGQITVASADGGGTTFRISLPIRQAQPTEQEAVEELAL